MEMREWTPASVLMIIDAARRLLGKIADRIQQWGSRAGERLDRFTVDVTDCLRTFRSYLDERRVLDVRNARVLDGISRDLSDMADIMRQAGTSSTADSPSNDHPWRGHRFTPMRPDRAASPDLPRPARTGESVTATSCRTSTSRSRDR